MNWQPVNSLRLYGRPIPRSVIHVTGEGGDSHHIGDAGFGSSFRECPEASDETSFSFRRFDDDRFAGSRVRFNFLRDRRTSRSHRGAQALQFGVVRLGFDSRNL